MSPEGAFEHLCRGTQWMMLRVEDHGASGLFPSWVAGPHDQPERWGRRPRARDGQACRPVCCSSCWSAVPRPTGGAVAAGAHPTGHRGSAP